MSSPRTSALKRSRMLGSKMVPLCLRSTSIASAGPSTLRNGLRGFCVRSAYVSATESRRAPSGISLPTSLSGKPLAVEALVHVEDGVLDRRRQAHGLEQTQRRVVGLLRGDAMALVLAQFSAVRWNWPILPRSWMCPATITACVSARSRFMRSATRRRRRATCEE